MLYYLHILLFHVGVEMSLINSEHDRLSDSQNSTVMSETSVDFCMHDSPLWHYHPICVYTHAHTLINRRLHSNAVCV